MEECEQFRHNHHLYNICTGTANMPKWKIDKYRINFGLSPLFNEPAPEIVFGYDNIGYGPGSELLSIYAKQGMPPCQDCFNLARKMNIWGDGCSTRVEEIVEDMFPRAKKWVELNMPWASLFPIVGDPVIRMRLRMDISRAIEAWKQEKATNKKLVDKPQKQTAPKVVTTGTSGCGCK
jgi:hypothetical protein